MGKHKSHARLQHMLENALKARQLSEKLKRQDLDEDWVRTLALVRLFEVIGEAANRIPVQEQEEHPEIPWAEIIGLRNRLIHGYDSIDLDILWEILSQDLPPLVDKLQVIISTSGSL